MSEDSMPDNVLSVADAKRRFSELIDRVSRGETFVVTRHGRPVLKLSTPLPAEKGQPEPLGLAAAAGIFADWEDFEEIMKEVYESRQHATDRPPPDFSDID